MPSRSKASFTLIELLIVIAIIAVLAVIVLLVINPAAILQQNRDSTRLSDMSTLNTAVNLYNEDQGGSLGTASTTYISIPDPSATSTLGDQCQGLGLPALPSGDVYHCAASSTYKHTDGTGWIPLNFGSLSSGDPLGTLPTDPTNQTSTGLYYTYTVQGSNYELTAIMESTKQKAKLETNPTLTDYPGVDAAGNDLALSALYNPSGIAGYWKFDEGSGSTTADSSGNGNTGTLQNGPAWATGKVGDALNFDGNSSDVDLGTNPVLNPTTSTVTVAAWIDSNVTPTNWTDIEGKDGGSDCVVYNFPLNPSGQPAFGLSPSGSYSYTTAPANTVVSPGVWYLAAGTYDGSYIRTYVNGLLDGSVAYTSPLCYDPSARTVIGVDDYWTPPGYPGFDGLIDDVRIYNRVLSPAEILAIYNAER